MNSLVSQNYYDIYAYTKSVLLCTSQCYLNDKMMCTLFILMFGEELGNGF